MAKILLALPEELRRFLILMEIDARVAISGVQGLYEIENPLVPFGDLPKLFSEFGLHSHSRMFQSVNSWVLPSGQKQVKWEEFSKEKIMEVMEKFDFFQKSYNYEEVMIVQVDIIFQYLDYFEGCKSFLKLQLSK